MVMFLLNLLVGTNYYNCDMVNCSFELPYKKLTNDEYKNKMFDVLDDILPASKEGWAF